MTPNTLIGPCAKSNLQPLFVGALCLHLFCYALLCVHSSFAIILKRKRKLVALVVLSNRRIDTINVMWLFLTVSLGWSAVCECSISLTFFYSDTNVLGSYLLSEPIHIAFVISTFTSNPDIL